MREILFRGKRLDNGEWVYGNLVRYANGDAEIWEIFNPDIYTDCRDWVIIPETVGQYTGVNDCTSVKIFEGDIFSDGSICVMFKTRIVKVWASGDWEDLDLTETKDVIIGNIHDNPELLGVED